MDQVVGIVKKNMISIICGVIALIAILAVFWPLSGMFAGLQEKASARGSAYSQLRDLLTKERHLPVVSLREAEPRKLEQFPTNVAIERGEKVKADIEKEAKLVFDEAVKINRGDKKPLVAEALPQPPQRSYVAVSQKFQQAYAAEMDYANPDPAARAKSMPVREMKAGVVPTADQIKAEQDRITKIIRTNEEQRDEKNRVLNEPQVRAKIDAESAAVPDILRHQVAKGSLVYVDPGSFTIVERILPPARAPTPQDMFWAQMTYWLQQDVCRAIAEANTGASDVMNSTVKRVMKVALPQTTPQQPLGFTMPAAAPSTEGQEGYGGDDASLGGAAVPSDPTQPITPNYVVSPTGRYSNALYDVIQFQLSLIVDANRVPVVLQALSKNRFMTVYNTNITVVDSGAEQAAGYFYGPHPVVRLELDCEALFLREWTKPYMPAYVKQRLGVVDDPAAGAAGEPAP